MTVTTIELLTLKEAAAALAKEKGWDAEKETTMFHQAVDALLEENSRIR